MVLDQTPAFLEPGKSQDLRPGLHFPPFVFRKSYGNQDGIPKIWSKHPWNKNQEFQEHHQEKKTENTWNILESSPETVTILYWPVSLTSYRSSFFLSLFSRLCLDHFQPYTLHSAEWLPCTLIFIVSPFTKMPLDHCKSHATMIGPHFVNETSLKQPKQFVSPGLFL